MNVKAHHSLDELLSLYKTETNPKLARRIQAVCLARKTLTCPQIMDITAAKRRTIQTWIHWYNQDGIEGLKDQPRSGRPAKLSATQQRKLQKRINAGPTASDGTCVLNGPAIRRILEREFGVLYCLNGVYELLHRLGYSCLCPRPRHERADPELQETFKKTFPTYWTRSKPNIQASESKCGSRMKPGSGSKGR